MRQDLTEKYGKLYMQYSRVGCPATGLKEFCENPDLCAHKGGCVNLIPHTKEASDGGKVQEK